TRLEDAVLAQMQELDRETEERETLTAEVEQAEKDARQRREELQDELDKGRARMDELRKQRRQAAKDVPDEIFAKYERLIERRGQTAMVPVVNGSCQGCFMKLRPETVAQLRKGSDLVTCHSCGRILYLEPEE
ncbi:MAG: zinc ribbon domain-containing protein, partial [Planctomycetota bacterium]